MKVNDKHIKEMVSKVNETHTSVKVIETKITAMEDHMRFTQWNGHKTW